MDLARVLILFVRCSPALLCPEACLSLSLGSCWHAGVCQTPPAVPSARLSTSRTSPYRCTATLPARLDHESRRTTRLRLSCSTARYHGSHGSQIGKPEELMNWDAAGLKRGPYILRIDHRNPPPRTIPCAAESLPSDLTDLPVVSACLFDMMRAKDPPNCSPSRSSPSRPRPQLAQLTGRPCTGWASALPAGSPWRDVVVGLPPIQTK